MLELLQHKKCVSLFQIIGHSWDANLTHFSSMAQLLTFSQHLQSIFLPTNRASREVEKC